MKDNIVLVGEANPYGNDPHFALYPSPQGSAGYRLCILIMQLTRATYLADFDRVDLCKDKWNIFEATATASTLTDRWAILCGTKVAKAFAYGFSPPSRHGKHLVIPHPSGLCRMWTQPGMLKSVRNHISSLIAEHKKG